MFNWSFFKILASKLRKLMKNALMFESKIRDAKHEAR